METATQILEMTAQLLRPEESVTIGVLPPEGGMTLQVAGGAADARYLDGSSRRHLTLQLLCKDTQKRSFDRLAVVCRKLEALREFPPVDSGQILLYEAESDPQFVTFESPWGMTIYTAVVYVYYYI